MQSDNNQLYKLTAVRTGTAEQIYKDIGNYVFHSLYANLRRPKTLIIKLKGVGTWYMRKARMELTLSEFPVDFGKTADDFKTDLGFLKYENKVEIHKIFKERLSDYERYISLRNEIRKKRYETQVLLQPFKRED